MSTKIKRYKWFFIIPFIISTLLVNNETSKSKIINKEIIDIKILMPAPFADSTKTLVEEFNQQYQHSINLKVIRGPMETEAVSDLAISNLLLGSNQYDALLIDVTWLPKYISAGWLEPISPYMNTQKWRDLLPGAKLGNSYNNIIYRWPLVSDIGLLYWRKDLMEEPPKTPEELENISRRLISQGKVEYGYVWQGKQYEGLSCVFLEIVNGFGGNWINKNGKVQLNSIASIEAISWLSKLINDGISPKSVISFTENESLQAFESGSAAFMRNWPYAWRELEKESSSVKGKFGVTTMVAKKGYKPSATLGSWGFSILASSQNKADTFKVIEFLTSPQSQEKLFVDFGYSPVSKQLYENQKLVENYPILKVLKRGLDHTKTRPQTPIYAQISSELQRGLSKILTNKQQASEAMNYAHSNTQAILKSAGGY